MSAVLADHRTAPVSPGLRATLDLLRKVTLAPAEVTGGDTDAVREADVSDTAIEDGSPSAPAST